ncbi:MAG: NifU family protein [Sulfurovum sp.]|nr:NifU family protein [Sulfurovum sp.]
MIPFSDEELAHAVANYLPKISEYVASHDGTMDFAGVKDSVSYVVLGGTCNGCSMSTATTKMVIQKKLRELIHPEIVVESIFPDQQDMLPEGLTRA